jgi:hypothetical protein
VRLGLELDELAQPRRVELHLRDALALAQREVVLLLAELAYRGGERSLEALDLRGARLGVEGEGEAWGRG